MNIKLLYFSIVTLFLFVGNALAGNMVKNGEFKGMEPWKLGLHQEYEKLVKAPKCNGEFSVNIPYSTKGTYAVLSQQLPQIKEGQTYKLTFEAKFEGSEGSPSFGIHNKLPAKEGSRKKTNQVNIGCKGTIQGSEWQPYEVVFTAHSIASSDPQRLQFSFGKTKGSSSIKNVVLEKFDGEAPAEEGGKKKKKKKKK
jgi:hypothetical protein